MELARSLNRLAGHVREEIAARRRTLALLDEQEAAIRANDPAATAEAVERLDRELTTCAERSRRRAGILADLGAHWGVRPDLLSLGSIIERAGDTAAVLAPLRAELRDASAAVVRKNRLLGALIGMHRRVLRDVIETVLDEEPGAALSGAGTLIDAEA